MKCIGILYNVVLCKVHPIIIIIIIIMIGIIIMITVIIRSCNILYAKFRDYC